MISPQLSLEIIRCCGHLREPKSEPIISAAPWQYIRDVSTPQGHGFMATSSISTTDISEPATPARESAPAPYKHQVLFALLVCIVGIFMCGYGNSKVPPIFWTGFAIFIVGLGHLIYIMGRVTDARVP